jgi:hypothetical protein
MQGRVWGATACQRPFTLFYHLCQEGSHGRGLDANGIQEAEIRLRVGIPRAHLSPSSAHMTTTSLTLAGNPKNPNMRFYSSWNTGMACATQKKKIRTRYGVRQE